MRQHQNAIELAERCSRLDLNEADTRHQIIDPLIHDVLGWPRARVNVEEFIAPGYADYVLRRSDGSLILLLEAKRSGKTFELPASATEGSAAFYMTVRTLLTDESTRAAMMQVRSYCVDNGCEVAAITNGRQFVFFRVFQRDADWKALKAFVVPDLSYFSMRFVEADQFLSYEAIANRGSLRRMLLDKEYQNREYYFPRSKIGAYSALVDANQYASMLRPLVDRFFGVLPANDSELLEHCYVSDREYDLAFANARRRLEDEITPYLQQYRVQNFTDAATGGGFTNRLTRSLIAKRSGEVIVLFGGKGVGKSTFLNRLLFHKPPQVIKSNAVICLIDLLRVTDTGSAIENELWSQLNLKLDINNILEGDRVALEQLFEDRMALARKQSLYGLDQNSEQYNLKVNEMIAAWHADRAYVAERLADYWRKRHRAIIVVVDNTDQFSPANQELCFTIAHDISRKLSALVVISMREERFYASSIHGVLDAYQNSGFHITAPPPREVFTKRLQYVMELLMTEDTAAAESLPYVVDQEVLKQLLRVLLFEFNSNRSHLAGFLEACSHGNVRLALELFRGFIVSGYLNVREVTSADKWILQTHQVIKPFMIPSRFFYDEELSKIPNVYQIRSKAHGSHFTALRVLSKLLAGHDRSNAPFVQVASLAAEFSDVFNMKEDFELNLDVLLRHRLIEANNRLEVFDGRADSVKITSYGAFMLRQLAQTFTYLELVCTDCAIADSRVANDIAAYSNDEYQLYMSGLRFERVYKRIEKANAFLEYLETEERREFDLYKAHGSAGFTSSLRTAFDREKAAVVRSARRNSSRRQIIGDRVEVENGPARQAD